MLALHIVGALYMRDYGVCRARSYYVY